MTPSTEKYTKPTKERSHCTCTGGLGRFLPVPRKCSVYYACLFFFNEIMHACQKAFVLGGMHKVRC